MKHNIYIGVDNGSTGSIAMLFEDDRSNYFFETPVKEEQDYTKAKKILKRIDWLALYRVFQNQILNENAKIVLERPLVNPTMFRATGGALRAYEATIIVKELMEELNGTMFSLETIDSKQWQKEMLPHGTKGKDDLKKTSVDVGCRLFPQFRELIVKHGDADGLLIAEWARRKNL